MRWNQGTLFLHFFFFVHFFFQGSDASPFLILLGEQGSMLWKKTEPIKTLPGSTFRRSSCCYWGREGAAACFRSVTQGGEGEESISNHPGWEGGWENTDSVCFKSLKYLTLTVARKNKHVSHDLWDQSSFYGLKRAFQYLKAMKKDLREFFNTVGVKRSGSRWMCGSAARTPLSSLI